MRTEQEYERVGNESVKKYINIYIYRTNNINVPLAM